MANQGYYGGAPQEQPGGAYQMQEPQYQPPPQPPPQYGQPMPSYTPQDNKGSFDQTFKIEKPKWNDLWAGILVSDAHLTCPSHAWAF